MFGLEFLFSAGLWALPIAGLPVILHLLFRRKSPVVAFSTLRFIKLSIQHTAARKKVHRWLLLACRVLLLALLVWAIAQPAISPAAGWAGKGKSTVAVIVVDTSYSMELKEGDATLLAKADGIVRSLLADQLHGAKVAVLRSAPAPADRPELKELQLQEQLRDASEVQWSPLRPQAALQPLADRVSAAIDLLKRQPADDKWLVVVSDFQGREFPRPLPAFADGRTVLIDLHPEDARSAGVTRVAVQPEQPTPGIKSAATVEVTGRANDVRQVNLSIAPVSTAAAPPPAGAEGTAQGVVQLPPQPANLDRSGHARLRFPLEVPPSGWLRLDASIPGEEPLAWARTRSLLLQVPPRQVVTVLEAPGFEAARHRVAWALDPSEGQFRAWALSVQSAPDLTPQTNVAVQVLTDWPDAARAARLLQFVRAGNTLIWFMRPGLEEAWDKLPAEQRRVLADLLPGLPGQSPDTRGEPTYTTGVAAPQDPVLAGLTDEKYQINSITVRRFLPFDAVAPDATVLLKLFPATPVPGKRPHGLLFRRPAGAGTVFTFATLPDRRYSSLHQNQTFVPMVVQMSLRPPGRSDAQNVEIGRPLVVSGQGVGGLAELRVQGPTPGDVSVVKATVDAGNRGFAFDRADVPGLYTWRRTTDDAVVAMTNVQLPADEAELKYVPAGSVMPESPSVVVAHSAEELAGRFAALATPEPRWAVPIGIVMGLLCVEALLGSASKLWKPPSLRAFLPRLRGATSQ